MGRPTMTDLVLTTLNARYAHCSFGLRYLFANLGSLQERAIIQEFTIKQQPIDIVEAIIALKPRIVGIGVYIWNASLSARVVSLLKKVAPHIVVVLGGPEVSYEWQEQDMVAAADYLIRGEGDLAFAQLCGEILQGDAPSESVIDGGAPTFESMCLPYRYYSDEDIAQRVLYVEASRGCPFRCEFCLSSLDIGVRGVPTDRFKEAMSELMERGARSFKFVDRTFNLDIKTSGAILEFFLEGMTPDLHLHFELIPDRLPQQLRALISEFPPGSLQFEVGIQTFDQQVNGRIQRRQNNDKAEANLRYLAQQTGVHVHTDLIVGLPGESVEGFGRGFDRLVGLEPEEIQVGILKRLRGTSLGRHDQEWGMVYSAEPPYEVLATSVIPFADMQRMKRFARYWGLIANNGNFVRTTPLVWDDDSPFEAFLSLSDWLYARLGRSFGISLQRLTESLFIYLTQVRGLSEQEVGAPLLADYRLGGRRPGIPDFLEPFHVLGPGASKASIRRATARQARHLLARQDTGDPPAES